MIGATAHIPRRCSRVERKKVNLCLFFSALPKELPWFITRIVFEIAPEERSRNASDSIRTGLLRADSLFSSPYHRQPPI
jgi:hypothetical protein